MHIEPVSSHELLEQSLAGYGCLHTTTLVFLFNALQLDRQARVNSKMHDLLVYLMTYEHLQCESCYHGIAFDGIDLSWLQARWLAAIYSMVGAQMQAVWVLGKMLECSNRYKRGLQQEYYILEELNEWPELTTPEKARRYRERMLEIEDIWTNEVEAAAPDANLAAACRGEPLTT